MLPGSVLAAAFLAAGDAAGQCQYEVVQLDYPIDCTISTVITNGSGLNNHGAVVGSYKCAVWTHTEAFLWTPEDGFVTLPRPPDVWSSAASDINDNGVIVGTYVRDDGFKGFVYEDGQYTELPPLQGPYSWASAINNTGSVVGRRTIRDDTAPFNAFVWSAEAGFTDLGVMNGPSSGAKDIDSTGRVVGWTGDFTSVNEAFLWQDGELTLLGPIPGGATSIANAISASGALVGSGLGTQEPGEITPAFGFVWGDGGFQLVNPVPGYDTSAAVDINSPRQVVGLSVRLDDINDRRAYLSQHGVTYDVNDLVPRGALLIERGWAINDAGQILADGGVHSFLLTPINRPLGDLDIDCAVGITDLLKLLAEWGEPESPADLNGDGTVDLIDFNILIKNWG